MIDRKDALALHEAVEWARAIATDQQRPAFISQTRDGYAVRATGYPDGAPYGQALPNGVVMWQSGSKWEAAEKGV